MEDQDDWIIDANGFYIATRSFLIRRGYCCASQCRNCPYINWRHSSTWEPLPSEAVQYAHVSPKVIERIKLELALYQQQCQGSMPPDEQQQAMTNHYRILLQRWET